MTRNEFELQAALAALAGLRNPREAEYLAQVQSRAQAVADSYAERGFFEDEDPTAESYKPSMRFATAGLPMGMRPKPPVAMVGMGPPGSGVKRSVVVNQTQSVPGRPTAPVHNASEQRHGATPGQNHHQTVNTAPKPRIQEPKVTAPVVVGGGPMPRLIPPAESEP